MQVVPQRVGEQRAAGRAGLHAAQVDLAVCQKEACPAGGNSVGEACHRLVVSMKLSESWEAPPMEHQQGSRVESMGELYAASLA